MLPQLSTNNNTNDVKITLKEILEDMLPLLKCNFFEDFDLIEKREKEIIKVSSIDVYNLLIRLVSSQIPETSLHKIKKPFKTYILKNMLTSTFKIGKTSHDDVMTRINQIQVGAETKLIHIIESDVENKLHSLYKDKRIKGEWFSLSDTDIEDIKAKFKQGEVA